MARGAVHVFCLGVGASTYGVTGAILAPAVTFVLTQPLLIRVVRLYGGTDPYHDVGFAVIGLAVSAGVFWLSWPSLAPLFVQ